MPWFLFAIAGYFLNAVVNVADKFLLGQRPVTKPPVYTFYIGILSIFAFILAPFGLAWPGFFQFSIALVAGVLFLLFLLNLFQAVDINDASRVFTVVGGLMPILILVLSFTFLDERLSARQILAFFLLVLGGILILVKKEKLGAGFIGGLKFVVLAILFGASSLVLTKYVFEQQGFVNGFVWTRLGIFLTALLFLIFPQLRQAIWRAGHQAKGGLSLLLVANKAMAGVASFFINLAIARASVTLVNAIQGTQYAFLLILVVILSKKFPWILEERMSRGVILQKILAILLIGVGLTILAF